LVSAIRRELLERTPPKRLPHVMGVEGMAVCLAVRWGVDADRLLLAALLHDLAKSWPKKKQREMLEGCVLFPPDAEDLEHPAIWHGLLAAQEARDRYGIEDDEILEAVAFHPTGAPRMRAVGLTLYVADFIEPSRSWPGADAVRAEVLRGDLREAILRIAPHKVRFLQEKGRALHPRTVEMAEWLETHDTER